MTKRLGIILEVAGSICLSGVSAYLTYPTLFVPLVEGNITFGNGGGRIVLEQDGLAIFLGMNQFDQLVNRTQTGLSYPIGSQNTGNIVIYPCPFNITMTTTQKGPEFLASRPPLPPLSARS